MQGKERDYRSNAIHIYSQNRSHDRSSRKLRNSQEVVVTTDIFEHVKAFASNSTFNPHQSYNNSFRSSLYNYFSAKGPLASTNAWSLTAFGPLHTENGVPDYELFFAEAPAKPLKIQFGLTTEAYEKSYGLYENSTMYLCIASILHPVTRGTVRLQSNDPHDPPLIDPRYFADSEDLEGVIKAIKACLEIGRSEPMKKIGSTHLEAILPGCETLHNYTCIAKTLLYTFHHQVGTAKMGDPKDPTTVVDPQLRVKNIKGLRCVDGSVLPTIPTGNTHIPITMVAEKASDMIKSTIKCNTQNPFISSNEFPSKPSFQNKLYTP